MPRYSKTLIEEVRRLRSEGKTYSEISFLVNLKIPKSTLSEWCKNTSLPPLYLQRITDLNMANLGKARSVALAINKIKREEYLKSVQTINLPISQAINDTNVAKIALAMLCLGEASKYTSKTRSFSLGNSDPRIIILFLALLKKCFNFSLEKVRCTVQCRADQNTEELENFWMDITKIPKRLFYKSRIDPRTIGKPTKKMNYKGVLRVDYFDTKVQLDLESLAHIVYNQFL